MFGLVLVARAHVKKKIFLLSAIFALGTALPVSAHHTHALYEPNIRIDLEGTVKEFQWINPHSWLYLTVINEDGEEEAWALEARAPFRLSEQGWDLDAIHPGDRISVTVKPLRRRHGGLLGTIRMEDGRVFVDED